MPASGALQENASGKGPLGQSWAFAASVVCLLPAAQKDSVLGLSWFQKTEMGALWVESVHYETTFLLKYEAGDS